MNNVNLNSILGVMDKMTELERVLGELYSECGKKDQDESEFWNVLSTEEFRHAEDWQRSRAIVSQYPQNFLQSKQFTTTGIATTIRYVQDIKAKVLKGAFSKNELFIVCRDLEESVLEAKGWDFLKTDMLGYMTIMNDIAEDTTRHRTELSNRIVR